MSALPLEIIPAILPKDFAEVEEKMAMVKGIVPLVQIDVCDGAYVPSFTWPYKKHDANFEAILNEERGMPFWEDMEFEVDLMIANPELHIKDWLVAGATRIIIHHDSTEKLQDIIGELRGLVDIGIALGIDTPVSVLAPYIQDIQFVQCMGIKKIGYQGQPFDAQVFDKIREIRSLYPDMPISVDGGVTLETAPELIDAGATRLVAGSAVFGSDNIVEAIHNLEDLG